MTKRNRLDTIIARQKLRLVTDVAFMSFMTAIGLAMVSVLS